MDDFCPFFTFQPYHDFGDEGNFSAFSTIDGQKGAFNTLQPCKSAKQFLLRLLQRKAARMLCSLIANILYTEARTPKPFDVQRKRPIQLP
jgi:hypothetical protein